MLAVHRFANRLTHVCFRLLSRLPLVEHFKMRFELLCGRASRLFSSSQRDLLGRIPLNLLLYFLLLLGDWFLSA